MEKAKFLGVRTPKPLKRLTKKFGMLITSAMTPRMPKLKTIAHWGVAAYA